MRKTLDKCRLGEFARYVVEYEDYFNLARNMNKCGQLHGLKSSIIENVVVERAKRRLLDSTFIV